MGEMNQRKLAMAPVESPDYKFRSLPPTATLEEVITSVNQQHQLAANTFNSISEIHAYLFNGTIPCTKPANKCEALDLAVKLRKRISWQQWMLAALTITIPATVTIVNLIMTNYSNAKANEAAIAGTKTTLAIEMPKYLQTVESIADKAADRASDRALRKFVAEQPPKPINKIPDNISRTR
jgi:hypothetical protein